MIDNYINNHDAHISELLDYLNITIQSFDDHIAGSIKWKVPYYIRKKHIGYLNFIKKKQVVELVFVRGYLFSENVKILLDKKDRKLAYGISYRSLHDINEEILYLLLDEAIRVDENVESTHKGFW